MRVFKNEEQRTDRIVLQPGRHWLREPDAHVYLDEPTEVTIVEYYHTGTSAWYLHHLDLSTAVERPDKLGRWRRLWRFFFRRRRALPEARLLP